MRVLAFAALVALAGCISDEPVQPTGGGAPAPRSQPLPDGNFTPPPDETLVFEGNLDVGVGSPAVAWNPTAPPGSFLFEFDATNATALVVTMAWNRSSSSTTDLQIVLEDAATGEALATADGASPLSIDGTAYVGKVLRTRTFASSAGGVVKDQPFTVTVTMPGAS